MNINNFGAGGTECQHTMCRAQTLTESTYGACFWTREGNRSTLKKPTAIHRQLCSASFRVRRTPVQIHSLNICYFKKRPCPHPTSCKIKQCGMQHDEIMDNVPASQLQGPWFAPKLRFLLASVWLFICSPVSSSCLIVTVGGPVLDMNVCIVPWTGWCLLFSVLVMSSTLTLTRIKHWKSIINTWTLRHSYIYWVLYIAMLYCMVDTWWCSGYLANANFYKV